MIPPSRIPFRRAVLQAYNVTYTKEESLGAGAFAVVSRVVHRGTGQEFAAKDIVLRRLAKSSRERLLREIEVMKVLDHPNIIKIVAAYRNPSKLIIIMELCTGGSLLTKLKSQPTGKLPEHNAHKYVGQMLWAVNYLHTNGICHRDLKLENFVFVDESADAQLKLIDFGLSRSCLKGDVMTAMAGSSFYVAPEVLRGHYTTASDLWSLGAIAFMLVTGRIPFAGNTEREIMNKIKTHPESVRTNRHLLKKEFSDGCRDFILQLMEPDHEKRITCGEALRDSWASEPCIPVTPAPQQHHRHRKKSSSEPTDADGGDAETLLVSQLMEFRDFGQLKRSALLAMAFNSTSAELRGLNDAFGMVDKDQTGVIRIDEFTALIRKHGISDSTEIQSYFDALDQDGTGLVKYSEFAAAALAYRQYDDDEKVTSAFDALDLDDSGEITVANLKALLGAGHDNDAVERVLAEGDYLHNGTINLLEFKKALTGATAGTALGVATELQRL